nr:hypothetical protein [Candidatus Freyrarchaeum guaymaensis]
MDGDTGEYSIELLSSERKTIQRLLNSLKEIKNLSSNPHDNLNKIKKRISGIEKLLPQCRLEHSLKKEILRYVEGVKSRIPGWEEEVKDSFGRKLDEELRKSGFELRGQYPFLKVAFYTLKMSLEDFKVLIWYGPQQEKLGMCNLNPNEVARKLVSEHKKITQREFDDHEFLSRLYEAYRIAAFRQGRKLGDQIRISDVLFEYALLVQDDKFRTDPVK